MRGAGALHGRGLPERRSGSQHGFCEGRRAAPGRAVHDAGHRLRRCHGSRQFVLPRLYGPAQRMQGCRGRGAELLQESTVSVARRLSDVDSIDAKTGYGTDAIGLCIEKRESYCCFNSPLSRMIQEQVRPQLGKGQSGRMAGDFAAERAFPSAWQSNARGADPSSAIEEADHKPVAILNHNRPAAYLVPAEAFETLMEALEDAELGEIVRQRRGGKTIKISRDEL